MKRATPGTKRKKVSTARKLASPRPRAKSKAKPARKSAAKTPAKKKSLIKTRKVVAKKKLAIAKTKSPSKPRKPVRQAVVSIAKPPKRVVRAARKPSVAKIKSPAKRKSTAKISPVKTKLPAFLLEGDEPGFLTEAGAAEKFALGPSVPPDHFDEGNAPLPSAYGTGKMFLTARDPHWLYANWDFSTEEQFRHNARSVDRHLIIRLHTETEPKQHVAEIHVHPESKHWFVHVEQAGQTYFTELGYYQTGRRWKSLTTSALQRTPPGNISRDSTVTFATIPLELSFETMLAMLRETADEDMQAIPLARAIENIRATAQSLFPDAEEFAEWTPEQTEELENILASARANVPLPNSDDSAREHLVSGESITSGPELFSSYCASFF